MKNILAMFSKNLFLLTLKILLFVVGFQITYAQNIVVVDDSYDLTQNLPLEVELFSNDNIEAGDTVVWTLISEPNFGTVAPANPMIIPPPLPPFLPTDPVWVLNESTTIFIYELTSNVGEPAESFQYSVCDILTQVCDTATVTINISLSGVDPVPPIAEPDTAVSIDNNSVEIDVLVNDLDLNIPPSLLTIVEVTQPDNATVNIENDKLLFTPNFGHIGIEEFSYTIENEYGLTSTTLVTVQVLGIVDINGIDADNDLYYMEINGFAPSVLSLYDFGEFGINNLGIIENDVFNPNVVISFCSEPVIGTVETGGSDGHLQSPFYINYTPIMPGTESFCYELCDTFSGTCDQATVTIVISNNPDDPIYIAHNDSYESFTSQPIVMNVLWNDFWLKSIAAIPNVVNSPSFGTTEITNTGLILYTPNSDFTGEDTFVYEICHLATGYCDQATVTVMVSNEPASDVIIAMDDFVEYNFTTSIPINVLQNDIGENLEVIIPSNSLYGSAVVNSDNTITYTLETETPPLEDYFDYWISTSSNPALWDTATVYLSLTNGGNFPPIAEPDAAVTLEGTPIEIDVLVNDLDTNFPPSLLTISEVIGTENATIAIQNNAILYTPADDYVGTEQFSYTIENEFGLTSTTWVTVVTGVQNVTAIDAVDDFYSVEINSNEIPTSISLYNIGGFLLDDFGITENDAFNPTTTISFCSEPQLGTIGIGGTDDVPQSSFFAEYSPTTPGIEVLCYELCDTFLGECDQAQIEITITMNPIDPVYPIANDDYYESPIPDPIVMHVLENDLWLPNIVLVPIIVTPPSFGTAVASNNGLITYVPNVGFMGVDTFIYEICDPSTGNCDQATVTVVISDEPFPDEIIAIDDFVEYNFNASVTIDVMANDSGPNIDVVEVSNAIHGSVVLNLDNTITYALVTGNAPPEDYFTYVICGGVLAPDEVECDTATVFISLSNGGENQAPVAVLDYAYTKEGIPVEINVLANDSDPDGPQTDLVIQPLISEYPEGMLNVMLDQTITFNPTLGFTGVFEFSYLICDGGSPEKCAEADVVIYVIDNVDGSIDAVDDVFTLDDSNIGGLSLTVLPNDITTENTQYHVFGQPKFGQVFWGINPAEPPFYTPNDPNFSGQDELFYIICDYDIDDCDVAMIYINASGTPSIDAVDDYVATAVNNAITIPIFNNDIYNISTYSLANVGVPNHGTVAVAESLPEQITYAPNTGFEGQDQFTYTLCNTETGECDQATVYIEVGEGLVAVDDYIAIEFYGPQSLNLQFNDLNATNALITNFTSPEFGTVGCDPAAIPCIATYEPAENFVGTDSFDYVICDNFANICDTATVYLTVGVDCSEGCVWAGDANDDGVANNFDILAVGLGFGEAGPPRINASINWYPQPATNWLQDITTFTTNDGGITFDSITVNAKHADCDGNGIIGGSDIDAISQNYGLTHAKNTFPKAAADAPAITFSLPEMIPANTWISVDVLLGSEEQLAEDVYGLAFTIDYDSDVVQLGSVSVDFDTNSWFDGGENISLFQDFGENGKLDIGYSRTDGQSISGYGKIATFSIFVIDNIAGKKMGAEIPFNISASNALMVNNEGFTQALNTEPAESVVTDIDDLDLSSVSLYPNPSSDKVQVNFGTVNIQSLQVFNSIGQIVLQKSFDGTSRATVLEVNDWGEGLYFVRFQTSNGIGGKRLQILK